MATLTVRLIRSFEYNNVRPIVLHNIDLSTRTSSFKLLIQKEISERKGLPPPFKKFDYDTLKISHKRHGTKSGNLAINVEDDATLILKQDRTLAECEVEDETELSFFRMEDYAKFKESAVTTVQWMQ